MDKRNLPRVSDTGLRRPTILVVGATGVLRPAALSLLAGDQDVLAVGRDAGRLTALTAAARDVPSSATLHVVARDASDFTFPAAIVRILDDRKLRLEAVLIYAPASSPAVIDALTEAVDCPVVELLTSHVATPHSPYQQWLVVDLPPSDRSQRSRRRRLVLGWRHRRGVPAWHSPQEISAAAVAALALPGDRILGSVHPWSDRPQ